MPLLTQLPRDKRWFLLFVGDSGSGKTCAGISFAENGPLYDFDIDQRIGGVRGHPMWEKWAPNVTYDSYDVAGGFKKVDDKLEILDLEFNKRTCPYKTILFDGFTTCEQMFTFDALELTGKLPSQTSSGKERHRKLGKITFPGWDEYNYEKLAFSQTMINLLALPCNVICTVHYIDRYSTEENKSNEVIGKKLSLRDRISQQVMKDFNEVIVFEKEFKRDSKGESPRYYGRFRSDLARTTFQKLPNFLEWTDKSFYQVLMEAVEKEKSQIV